MMYRLREKIRDVASRIRCFGWKIEGVADQLMDLEIWLKERNLDVWSLGEERERIEDILKHQDKVNIARYKEIDRLAAMYWKATGKWPKGYPKSGHYGIKYSYQTDREKYLPKGATMQVVSCNLPLQPPDHPGLVPMNRYGEVIDLSEVVEQQ